MLLFRLFQTPPTFMAYYGRSARIYPQSWWCAGIWAWEGEVGRAQAERSAKVGVFNLWVLKRHFAGHLRQKIVTLGFKTWFSAQWSCEESALDTRGDSEEERWNHQFHGHQRNAGYTTCPSAAERPFIESNVCKNFMVPAVGKKEGQWKHIIPTTGVADGRGSGILWKEVYWMLKSGWVTWSTSSPPENASAFCWGSCHGPQTSPKHRALGHQEDDGQGEEQQHSARIVFSGWANRVTVPPARHGCFSPKQVYLWRVPTPLKGVHARVAWFGVCLRACFPAKDTLDSLRALARMISHFSPSCLPLHSGFSARMISDLPPTCLPLVFQYTLRVRMLSRLSPTCLPVRSGWSQCSASHDFRLVPTCLHFPPSPSAMGTTATNQRQTSNTMKLDWSTNKPFGVNAGIDWYIYIICVEAALEVSAEDPVCLEPRARAKDGRLWVCFYLTRSCEKGPRSLTW